MARVWVNIKIDSTHPYTVAGGKELRVNCVGNGGGVADLILLNGAGFFDAKALQKPLFFGPGDVLSCGAGVSANLTGFLYDIDAGTVTNKVVDSTHSLTIPASYTWIGSCTGILAGGSAISIQLNGAAWATADNYPKPLVFGPGDVVSQVSSASYGLTGKLYPTP